MGAVFAVFASGSYAGEEPMMNDTAMNMTMNDTMMNMTMNGTDMANDTIEEPASDDGRRRLLDMHESMNDTMMNDTMMNDTMMNMTMYGRTWPMTPSRSQPRTTAGAGSGSSLRLDSSRVACGLKARHKTDRELAHAKKKKKGYPNWRLANHSC